MNASLNNLRPGMRPARPSYFGPPVESDNPRPIAVVLSSTAQQAKNLLPVLAGLGVTTIDRVFDSEATKIVAAVRPQLSIIICDPESAEGIEMIGSVPKLSAMRLLVVDASGASGEDSGIVSALELGADAALSMHDKASVVRATIISLLRRSELTERSPGLDLHAGTVGVGQLKIDHDRFEVVEGGELVPMTPTEFRIVAHLAAHGGKVQSASEIIAAVHPFDYSEREAQQTVKVYIRRIRRKLERCAKPSVEIINARTFGYSLRAMSPKDSLSLMAA